MKFCLALLMVVCCLQTQAQINSKLYGSWVKVKVAYKNGTELTDDNALKYNYIRYNFRKPNQLTLSYVYDSKGDPLVYSLNEDLLSIKNKMGFPMSNFLVKKVTRDSLIILQQNSDDFEAADCLVYTLINEDTYKRAIPLKATDIISVNGDDTLYKASAKIFADFKGETAFHQLAQNAVYGLHDQQPLSNHFLATFIVNKNGEADSLHIVEGINPDFDKQFTKTFNKFRKDWIPATYNGKIVRVKMIDEFRFIPREKYPIFEKFVALGDKAMMTREYEVAIFNFDKALNSYESGEIYYKKALCEGAMGDRVNTCADIQKAENLGYSAATGLMAKICR